MLSEESKKKKAEYDMKYRKDNMKRIILDVQKPFYDEIKEDALLHNESVSGYIKKAIQDRLNNKDT